MGFSTYPFVIDRQSGTLEFSYEYTIPAYIDPETDETFEQTYWILHVLPAGGAPGSLLGHAGESGQVTFSLGLLGGDGGPAYRLEVEAFNSFSGVSISAAWNLQAAAYSDLPLVLIGNGDMDVLIGGLADDVLRGNGGDDILDGGEGVDILDGGAGDDYLDGGVGADVMVGGDGNDTYLVDDLDDLTAEMLDGDVDTVLALVDHTLGANVEFLELGGSAALSGRGNEGDNVIQGNAANNVLWGLGGDDILYGAEGNDRLYGGAGSDVLFGGLGNDHMDGGGDDDIYIVDSRDDRVTEQVNEGFDWIVAAPPLRSYTLGANVEGLQVASEAGFRGFGNGLDNEMVGAFGKDYLFGGAGADTLYGGSGDDRLEGGTGADALHGQGGVDTADYAASDAGVHVSLAAGTGFGGHAQGDTLSGVENLIGSSLSDELIGNEQGNSLRGGAGDDVLEGGGGGDRIEGGSGADALDGGAGTDTLSYEGSTGAVVVNLATNTAAGGDAEGDTIARFENLRGTASSDTLTGNGLANTLAGGAGDDVINGGGGNDTINGGRGADWLDGGGGVNRLSYAGAQEGVAVYLATMVVSGGDAEGDTVLNFSHVDGGDGCDWLTGSDGSNFILGNGGADTIDAGGGNDRVRGGAGADIMDGGSGLDTLSYADSKAGGVAINLASHEAWGGDAWGDAFINFENVDGSERSDQIIGDAGNNILSGRAGYDFIDGGAGNDTLTGGTHGDTFRFHSGHGEDVVTDFTHASDQIFIDFDGGFYAFEQVMALASNDGLNTRFDFGDGDVLVINNMLVGDFAEADFSFLV